MKKYILLLVTALSFAQASNQMVTFTQAQSLGYTLNSGQSHTTSNQCMTKSEALAKYNLDVNAMSSYTSNQLVPKSTWVSGVNYYVYKVSTSSFLNRSESCNTPFVVNKYSPSSTITNGMVIYNESSFSTVYSGNGNYFKIENYSCLIDALGNLSSPQICN